MRTLYAWIDLNAPYYGAFTQIDLKPQSPKGQVERRMELAEKYSGVQVDWQKEIADYADWLKENKKGWEENIGKLCDESILWQRGLFPQSTIEGGNSFYGISINLDSIHRPIKSIDDYIVEKENGEKRLEEITAAMQRQQTEREELQEQLKRKYQPQIKEQKAIISQIEYELEQLERQYQQDMLDLERMEEESQ